MVKIGKYNYEKSSRKNKKLKVIVDGKTIHFGDSRYKHFKDLSGIWSKLDHLDLNRKENYLLRSSKIKNKQGKLTADDVTSPNYHARKILWDA